MGYSYYEYAQSLREEDPFSALLFTEYALELSNLDIYFKRKSSLPRIELDSTIIVVFLSGIAIGLLTGYLLKHQKPNKKKSKKKIKKISKKRKKRK